MAQTLTQGLARWAMGRLFPGVIAEVHSGLGNQMFQYALGRSMADRLGTGFALCQRDFSQDYIGRTYGLDAFQLRAAQIGRWALSVYKDHAGWRGRIAALADDQGGADSRLWVEEPYPFRFVPELLTRRAPVLLTGYWQNERYFAENAARIRQDFTPAAPLLPDAAALAAQMAGPDSVSVHIRRGDYAHHPHIRQVHGTLPDTYYADALALLAASLPSMRLFVFSDEPAWAEANLPWPSGTVIVHTPANAPAWHDLHLMTHCRHHVIANSSYSWWGAWLGERPGSIVIAPRLWSREAGHAPDGLIPTRWRLL